jgi:hypothetical protein
VEIVRWSSYSMRVGIMTGPAAVCAYES